MKTGRDYSRPVSVKADLTDALKQSEQTPMPVYPLSNKLIFPPVRFAGPEGLLAVGGDLSVERLLLAYKSGIFPWYSDDEPILWWSPDPRLVLYPEELKVSRSLSKTIRQGVYHVTMDTAFAQVISACAQTRLRHGAGTWITTEMQAAYCRLHECGYAHSVEAWYNNQLVGGLYGVSMGRAFFGESMFSTMSNASKVCLVHLARILKERCFKLIDCQVTTDHLLRMGARNIPRNTFISELQQALGQPDLNGSWVSLSQSVLTNPTQ